MSIESMVLRFGPEPPYRRQIGDIKLGRDGRVFICRQQRMGGAVLVSRGRPCLEWVELSPEELQSLAERQRDRPWSFAHTPRYAASRARNGRRVDFSRLLNSANCSTPVD